MTVPIMLSVNIKFVSGRHGFFLKSIPLYAFYLTLFH